MGSTGRCALTWDNSLEVSDFFLIKSSTSNAVLQIKCAFHIIVIDVIVIKGLSLNKKIQLNDTHSQVNTSMPHLMVFSLAQIYTLYNILTMFVLQSCPPTNK